MKVLVIFGLTAIGFALGIAVTAIPPGLIRSERLEDWRRLPAPPQPVVELMGSGAYGFLIRTADGSTYEYDSWQNQGWLPTAVPENDPNPFEVTRPCDLKSREFHLPPVAPGDMKDCVQVKTMYADGYIQYAAVLDQEGNVWKWEFSSAPPGLSTVFCLPPLGALVGLAVGIMLTMAVGKSKEA